MTGSRPDIALSPLELLVLQMSPFCNIDCDYCYLPDRSNRRRMSLETVRQTLSAVMSVPELLRDEGFTVLWHAGEPLTVPIDHYRRAIKIIESVVANRVPVSYQLQTNGTLIDDAWCEFFAEFDVRIGLSLDGPPLLHDRHRVDRLGRGTHAAALRGMRLLRRHRIPFGMLCVVTEDALDRADELYEFLVLNGVGHVALNIEEQEGVHVTRAFSRPGIRQRYKSFLARLYERSCDAPGIWIREIETAKKAVRYGDVGARQAARPFAVLSVDTEGNFSTYSPELLGQACPEFDDFALGNVWTTPLLEAFSGPTHRRLGQAIRGGIEKCRRECGYFDVCGGGTPSNKYYENGTFESSETRYCRLAIQVPIDVVLDRYDELIEGEAQPPEDSPSERSGARISSP